MKGHERHALVLLGAVTVALVFLAPARSLAQAHSPEAFTRQVMLQDIATNVLAPGWRDVASKCRELTNAMELFAKDPTQSSLENARNTWLAAAQAADRLRCFQSGPLADRGSTSTFYYWQVLPARIEAVLKSTNPINQALVDELGATSKGLCALEYLLFDDKGGNPGMPVKLAPALELMKGEGSERRRAFLLALGRDLEAKASQVATDWTASGDATPTARFVAAGQDSINLLVNQLAGAVEEIAEKRLHFVLLLRPPISEDLYRIERSRSGASLEGVLSNLEGVQQVFRGTTGLRLADALRPLNATVESRLAEQFEKAIAATRAIGSPLEQAAIEKRSAVEKAYQEIRALEILIKVDVASTVGVTLTLTSNDGD